MKVLGLNHFRLVLFSCVLIGLILFISGCSKKESEPVQAEEQIEAIESTVETAKDAIVTTAEQKVCPVMGAPINKALFVEYKGKKVYFCCAGCEKKFEENPEQYLAKLPQFND
ncbi:MAG: YHS domain-containing protein [Planctomycetota bacterium]|jgi:YHS domain-containing protein